MICIANFLLFCFLLFAFYSTQTRHDSIKYAEICRLCILSGYRPAISIKIWLIAIFTVIHGKNRALCVSFSFSLIPFFVLSAPFPFSLQLAVSPGSSCQTCNCEKVEYFCIIIFSLQITIHVMHYMHVTHSPVQIADSIHKVYYTSLLQQYSGENIKYKSKRKYLLVERHRSRHVLYCLLVQVKLSLSLSLLVKHLFQMTDQVDPSATISLAHTLSYIL